MSFAVQRVSDFVSTPYVLRQRHGIKVFPPCDPCDTDDVQDEQHVLFHCANPHVISLRRKYASLFPPTGAHDVFTFLSQNNNKLYFPLYCSWVSWWGGQLERRGRSCFWGLHASFVLFSAPLHVFSWHSWFCEALSASCFLFLTEASCAHILRHISSFFLVLLDAFSSRFFKTNVLFL